MSGELQKRQDDTIEITRHQAEVVVQQAAEIKNDLEFAIALIKKYQRNLSMLGAPDPDIVEARRFIQKHGEVYEGWSVFQIFADGVDITDHPDSILSDAEHLAILELEEHIEPTDDN